jgi:hypothetical protein
MSKLDTLKQIIPSTNTANTFLKSILLINSITLSPYIDMYVVVKKKRGWESIAPTVFVILI